MKIKLIIFSVFLLVVVGCDSTPKQKSIDVHFINNSTIMINREIVVLLNLDYWKEVGIELSSYDHVKFHNISSVNFGFLWEIMKVININSYVNYYIVLANGNVVYTPLYPGNTPLHAPPIGEEALVLYSDNWSGTFGENVKRTYLDLYFSEDTQGRVIEEIITEYLSKGGNEVYLVPYKVSLQTKGFDYEF